MPKKITKWDKNLKKGLGYMLDLIEEETQKNETKKQTFERRKRMSENAKTMKNVLAQCPKCDNWTIEGVKEKSLCKFHEKIDYPCAVFIQKIGR